MKQAFTKENGLLAVMTVAAEDVSILASYVNGYIPMKNEYVAGSELTWSLDLEVRVSR